MNDNTPSQQARERAHEEAAANMAGLVALAKEQQARREAALERMAQKDSPPRRGEAAAD